MLSKLVKGVASVLGLGGLLFGLGVVSVADAFGTFAGAAAFLSPIAGIIALKLIGMTAIVVHISELAAVYAWSVVGYTCRDEVKRAIRMRNRKKEMKAFSERRMLTADRSYR